MLSLTLRGFREALGRVKSAPATVPESLFIPLTEATWWAICADEAFETDPTYKSRRNQDRGGKTLLGMRYARNALGHHWAFIAIVKRGGGWSIPWSIPWSITQYAVWVATVELPDFGKHSSPTIEAAYTEYVASKPVVETLELVDTWLTAAETKLPGSVSK